MSAQAKLKNHPLSKQAEEHYLEETLAVVKNNLKNYGSEVDRMRENIEDMRAHYNSKDVEMRTVLNNTITMHEHMKRALLRNEKALNKPYFGRIIFKDKSFNKEESIYIGKGGIAKDATHWAVVDWRAPVANAYYENGLGKCSYEAPGGTRIQIDLKLKRTYEIESGKLIDYFDSEVIANDDLLTKYLAKNKQAVLSEIVATIQKEQNEIIRKSPYHNIIVQGVAGSGKTTVAMHRISYILYNYEERFKPDDFYIVGSNRILLDYITGVLPDLDVYGIRQMTMEQLFVRLLYEDWDDTKYRIKSMDTCQNTGAIKGSSLWFHDLEAYCLQIESDAISQKSVYLNPRQFVEGIRDGKIGVFDETDSSRPDAGQLVCLIDGDAVERYVRQNPAVSVQNKINMLNLRLRNKIKEEFLGKGVKYTEAERKAILKAYRGHYGGKVWKRSIYELYNDFLKKQNAEGYGIPLPDQAFDVYDLAALAYLYKRIKETEVISEARHIVIDEAQDFGMMAYHVLKFCIYRCTYTVMGDVCQNIHFGYGLNDWEELRDLLLTDSADSFGILKKSYRNTVEISNFATNILHHGNFSVYPVEPIIRHGKPVRVEQFADRPSLIRAAADICRKWLNIPDGQRNAIYAEPEAGRLDTIAVICRDQAAAAAAARELSDYIDVIENDPEKTVFGSGVMVLPVEYTKGLEFDAVLILDPTQEDYPADDGHSKLLYVAATRALHELCALHRGNLTGLIADPAPERRPVEHSAAKRNRNPEQNTGAKGRGNSPIMSDIIQDCTPNSGSASLPGSTSGLQNRPIISAAQIKPRNKKISIVQVELPPETPAPKKAARTLQTGHAKPAAPVHPTLKPDHANKTKGADTPSTCLPTDRNKSSNRNTDSKMRFSANSIKFGDMPATEKLRPSGHGKIDLAVRWVAKQPDGLYLHSRYGVLRLSPVGSAIIRVTFAKGGQILEGIHPGIAVRSTDKRWMYKESGAAVDLMTDELYLQIDKSGGSIRYMTRDKKLLLAERSKECRQLENIAGGDMKIWLYLDWQKNETLYAMGTESAQGIKMRGTARYISHKCGLGELPFLLSDRGYGLLPATDSPVLSCDIPAYGSYLHVENDKQMDFYFITGKRQPTILNAYAYLCGKL